MCWDSLVGLMSLRLRAGIYGVCSSPVHERQLDQRGEFGVRSRLPGGDPYRGQYHLPSRKLRVQLHLRVRRRVQAALASHMQS